jgi:hypothetical protein
MYMDISQVGVEAIRTGKDSKRGVPCQCLLLIRKGFAVKMMIDDCFYCLKQ